MKRIHSLLICLLVPASLLIQGHTTAGGGDHYRIYLNDKLIVEQFLTRPVEVNSLSLASAKETDKLVVHFSHCGQIGKSRMISIKNASGKLIKGWKFPDNDKSGMQLTVREVKQVIEKEAATTLHYSSKEMPRGKMLAGLSTGNGKTAKL